MPLFIGVTYYSYTAILERFCLWIDMTSFFVAIVIGQFISLRLLTASQAEAGLQRLGAIGLWTMIATFVVFSYAPPRTFLFKDYYKDEYGILQQYDMPVFSAKQSK
jgi:Ni,Fe-hydrogenase I cytochrome b subunit